MNCDQHAILMAALTEIRPFMPAPQYAAVAQQIRNPRGEACEELYEPILRLHRTITGMPKTYEQDGLGDQAIVHLHYFGGSSDWYITERDSDPDGEGQVQAFGLADLFGDGGELGYISIKEICEQPARAMLNIDFYFEPCTLAEVLKQREKRRAA